MSASQLDASVRGRDLDAVCPKPRMCERGPGVCIQDLRQEPELSSTIPPAADAYRVPGKDTVPKSRPICPKSRI